MPERQVDADRLPGSARSLADLVGRLGYRLTRATEDVVGPHGLTVDRWRVLDLLADGDGHPMTEIAAHAMVPAPTLTKIVDRLIASALVYRRPDEVDRRRVLVFLSDHGAQVYRRLASEVREAEGRITDELAGPEREHLVHLLGLLSPR